MILPSMTKSKQLTLQVNSE
uniref:Uncharacterized protein n=1 Tax=Rhizophora mucronata TaxID=61149 RepID=A0A2P2M4L3_RHIMU